MFKQRHSLNWCASECQFYTDQQCLIGHHNVLLNLLISPSPLCNFKCLEPLGTPSFSSVSPVSSRAPDSKSLLNVARMLLYLSSLSCQLHPWILKGIIQIGQGGWRHPLGVHSRTGKVKAVRMMNSCEPELAGAAEALEAELALCSQNRNLKVKVMALPVTPASGKLGKASVGLYP